MLGAGSRPFGIGGSHQLGPARRPRSSCGTCSRSCLLVGVEQIGPGATRDPARVVPASARTASACGVRKAAPTLFGRQQPLGVERGHRARAGGGHRLAVRVVGDVAGREHALDVRLASSPAAPRGSPPRRGRAGRGRAACSGRARSRRRARPSECPVFSPVFTFWTRTALTLPFVAEHLVDDGVRDPLDPLGSRARGRA